MPIPRWGLPGKAFAASLALLVALALPGLPAAQAGTQASGGPDPAAIRGSQPALAPAAQDPIQRVVELTNQERARAGLPPVTLDLALCRSAQAHSDDMAGHDFFSHAGSDGSDVGKRIASAGYDPVYAYGENIAAGQPSPEEAVNAWMNSETHRENILSPYYQHIGVAYAFNTNTTYGHYWTQDFGSHGPNPPPATTPPPPTPPRPLPAAAAPLPVAASAQIPRSISLSFMAKAVDLTNRERAKAGLPALVLDNALCNAAQAHSEDMAANGFFGHIGSGGSKHVDRMAAAGYHPIYTAAENVAAGQPSPEAVVEAWMNSAAHRSNILNPSLHHVGVGYAYAADSAFGHHWTQVFGSHSSEPPTPVPPTPAPPPTGWLHFSFWPLLIRQAIG